MDNTTLLKSEKEILLMMIDESQKQRKMLTTIVDIIRLHNQEIDIILDKIDELENEITKLKKTIVSTKN